MERSMKIERCIVTMPDYLTNISMMCIFSCYLELQLPKENIHWSQYCKSLRRELGLSVLSREDSNAEIQSFMCYGTEEISYLSDFIDTRNSSHNLQSINCPSLVGNDLTGVIPCILSLLDGLARCELSGNDQLLEERYILLPQKTVEGIVSHGSLIIHD